MRRIFITNDDGIDSDGLKRLAEAARDFGEVWVVSPEKQRSAVSHSILLREPIEVHPYDFPVEGVHAFSCSGMPADCVRVGTLNIMPGPPDVVFTGINFGYNTATDLQYSATAGAAMEGEFQGYLSIAFSEGTGGCHEVTDRYLKEIMAELAEKPYVPGQIYNVNFPDCRLSEFNGIRYDRKVSRRSFFVDRYRAIEEFPDGGVKLVVNDKHMVIPEEGTDYGAVIDRCISIGIVKNIGS